MKAYNGMATYEIFGMRGRQANTKTTPAKITPKRVETMSRTWDHAGNRRSAYWSGMNHIRLLSFQKNGEPLVIVHQPTPTLSTETDEDLPVNTKEIENVK